VVALLVIGATLCAGSLYVLVRRMLHIRRTTRASGEVILIETVHEPRPASVFDWVLIPRDVPVVQFETASGMSVVAHCPPTPCGQCSCGQRVSFLYDPRDPQHVVLSTVHYWRDLIPFILVGALCFISVLWLR
jgi:hypothetical protein